MVSPLACIGGNAYGTSYHVRACAAAEQLLASAVAERIFPAAVAEVGCSTSVLWRHACGTLSLDEGASPADVGTIFDLASLTKPIATTSVILQLIEQRAMSLDTRVSTLMPEWAGAGREVVTVRHLLEHSAGLSARLLDAPPHDRRAFEHDICTMPLEYPPGSRSVYTDLGFILLGFCAEQCGGHALASQVSALLATALADADAAATECRLFVKVPAHALERTAPTLPLTEDHRRGRRLVGEVHDNYAAVLGGFAGHAGLFGTACGVGSFARTVLRAARGDETATAPFTPAVISRAVTRSTVPGSSRALGWDTMLPTSSCGVHLSAAAFGHVGFTGTSLWIDPVIDRYFVLLTNRVCGGGSSADMQRVRRAFHDAVAP